MLDLNISVLSMFPFRIRFKIAKFNTNDAIKTSKKCKQCDVATKRMRTNETTARLGAGVATACARTPLSTSETRSTD